MIPVGGTPWGGQLRAFMANRGALWGILVGNGRHVRIEGPRPQVFIWVVARRSTLTLWSARAQTAVHLGRTGLARSPVLTLLTGLEELNAVGISLYRIYARMRRTYRR